MGLTPRRRSRARGDWHPVSWATRAIHCPGWHGPHRPPGFRVPRTVEQVPVNAASQNTARSWPGTGLPGRGPPVRGTMPPAQGLLGDVTCRCGRTPRDPGRPPKSNTRGHTSRSASARRTDADRGSRVPSSAGAGVRRPIGAFTSAMSHRYRSRSGSACRRDRKPAPRWTVRPPPGPGPSRSTTASMILPTERIRWYSTTGACSTGTPRLGLSSASAHSGSPFTVSTIALAAQRRCPRRRERPGVGEPGRERRDSFACTPDRAGDIVSVWPRNARRLTAPTPSGTPRTSTSRVTANCNDILRALHRRRHGPRLAQLPGSEQPPQAFTQDLLGTIQHGPEIRPGPPTPATAPHPYPRTYERTPTISGPNSNLWTTRQTIF